jgi:hypothetical protein
MRWILAGALALVATGCAAVAAPPAPPPPSSPAGPEAVVSGLLEAVPPAVLVDRAIMDLDSGDPVLVERARCVLLSVQDGEALGPLRDRARSAPAGSAARLEAVAVLLERGEAAGCPVADVVAASVRDLVRGGGASRGVLLALERIRDLGESALGELRAEALAGGPAGQAAARVLAALFGEVRPLPEARP